MQNRKNVSAEGKRKREYREGTLPAGRASLPSPGDAAAAVLGPVLGSLDRRGLELLERVQWRLGGDWRFGT